MKRRSRLVSFRVSEDEYQKLRNVCASVGARSLSDLARSAVGVLIDSADDGGEHPLESRMRRLDRTVQQLQHKVEELSTKLAETAADTAPAPCTHRATASITTDCAIAPISDPAANSTRPTTMTGLRPNRSDQRPNGICNSACVRP